ncbi:putative fructoselysine transporter [Halalkalicoccus paucihalophilus]|uniref:Putative fructoselysine transporter n=1 Tax=Halalkalicoccus paucihalophilus TaxID=1008153 RepID=A0A151AAY7_9EURY|nr:APC family permease [Halalkalicoccus paucihalophilus]KYH24866.1 putative fructoselysine transporter [Halalkalicoccus paucihalophilus]
MSEDEGGGFGVGTAVALGVGGIVGGGIYAAIGIVVAAAGVLTWFAYSLATIVVLCCAYSYVKLNDITENKGGSVTYIEELTGRSTTAGVVGWTLVVGYIGTMAMYAYAFGAYGQMMLGVAYVWGLPIRQFLSVSIIAVFVGINLLGAGSTAAVERYLVFVQAGIIAAFGLIGLWFGFSNQMLQVGLSSLVRSITSYDFNPILAASVGFVSFEGWQLLFYDQEQFDDPKETLAKGIFISIPIAAFIYILVGFVITSLLPEEVVAAQPEAALIYGGLVISKWLALAVGIAGLISTASAINSTLFSEAIFAKNLISDEILPERMGDPDADAAPTRTILVIGFFTAAFTILGSLEAVVEFASLAFIVVFGVMSALALAHRDEGDINVIPPLVGTIGSAAFFIMLTWYLYAQLPSVFWLVVIIAAIVFTVEAVYFERESLEEGIQEIEEQL